MPTPTGNEDLIGALSLAQSICWDESHGYTMGADMNPDTDCSGLIGYCLSNNGFNVPRRWDTNGMINTYLNNYQGFTEYIWDSSFVWQHGDIAVWDEYNPNTQRHDGHTFFYAEQVTGYVSNDYTNGDGTTGVLMRARIEASSDRGRPQAGDQDNGYGMHPEVWVHPFSFSQNNHVWHIFRWQGATPPIPISNVKNVILSRWIRRKRYQL